MASQILIVVTIGGRAAEEIHDRFRSWTQLNRAVPEVDDLCASLQANRTDLAVLYYTEWIDRWLLGDSIFGLPKTRSEGMAADLNSVSGKSYEALCLSRTQAMSLSTKKSQYPENSWHSSRLKEATEAHPQVEPAAVLIIRKILGGSATDEEINAATSVMPEWLARISRKPFHTRSA